MQQHHQRHAIPPELEARITEIEIFFAALQNRSIAAKEFPTLIETGKMKYESQGGLKPAPLARERDAPAGVLIGTRIKAQRYGVRTCRACS